MDQQPIEKAHPGDKTNKQAEEQALGLRHIFDWGFWTSHPLAIFTFSAGGLLLAPLTSFPGGNPRSLWYVALGLWIISGTIVWWIFSGIIARLEGRELLTKQELDQRENEYREGIRSRFESLEGGIGDAQKQLVAQQPRRLTVAQKKAIKEAIAPFTGQKITIMCLLYDTEATQYAYDFKSVFKESGWDCGKIENTLVPLEFRNVRMYVPPAEKLENVRAAAISLRQALIDLGITEDEGIVHIVDTLPADQITLQIGARPNEPIVPPVVMPTQPSR